MKVLNVQLCFKFDEIFRKTFERFDYRKKSKTDEFVEKKETLNCISLEFIIYFPTDFAWAW